MNADLGDETTAAVLEILCDVLGISEVQITDDFFLIGGDSLHMVEFVTRLSLELAVHLDPVEFQRNPQIASLVGSCITQSPPDLEV